MVNRWKSPASFHEFTRFSPNDLDGLKFLHQSCESLNLISSTSSHSVHLTIQSQTPSTLVVKDLSLFPISFLPILNATLVFNFLCSGFLFIDSFQLLYELFVVPLPSSRSSFYPLHSQSVLFYYSNSDSKSPQKLAFWFYFVLFICLFSFYSIPLFQMEFKSPFWNFFVWTVFFWMTWGWEWMLHRVTWTTPQLQILGKRALFK